MPLLDDILRLLGTNRTRMQWKVRAWKRGWERRKAALANRTAGQTTRQRARRIVNLLWDPNTPMVTTLLVISCIGVYAAVILWQRNIGLSSSLSPHTYALWRFGSEFSPDILDQGQWWRVVTAMFLHGGLLHIALNMLSLWSVGIFLEDTLGKAKTLVLYLVLGLASSAFSLWWHTHGGGVGNSVGASGAICGLIGVAIGFSLRHRNAARHLQSHYVGWALWIAVIAFSGMPIDNAAHVGGLASGVLAGLVVRRSAATSRTAHRLWFAGAALALAGTAVCFMMMARSPLTHEQLFGASDESADNDLDNTTRAAMIEAQRAFERDDDYLPQSHEVHYAGTGNPDALLARRMRRLFGPPTGTHWNLRDRATGVQLRIFDGDDTFHVDGAAADQVVAHLTQLLARTTPP